LLYACTCCCRKTLIPRDRGAVHLFSRAGPYSLLSLSIKYGWPELAILLLQHGYPPSKHEIYALVKIIRDALGTDASIYNMHTANGINPGVYILNHGIFARNGHPTNIAISDVDTIDADGRRVIACYVAAGYRGQKGDGRLLDKLQLPPNRSLDAASLTWTKEQVVGLVRLKQLCRTVIRGFLRQRANGGSVIKGIYQMNSYLPIAMMDYLALAEYTGIQRTYKPIH